MDEIGIGTLAEVTGVKVTTIRFYEQIGLLPTPTRTDGRQRRYDDRAVTRLTFIRHARDLGFEVEEVRQLLTLADSPDACCKTVDAIARHQVVRIDAKLKRLRAMRCELIRVITACHGERVRDCRILDALSEPSPSRRASRGR
jgi:DNA-binding transcriptional MerR regulator